MEKFNVNDLSEFSSDKRIRKNLYKGNLEVDLVFYQPDQFTPEHKHDNQDEVFYVVSGEGLMFINSQEVFIKEKDVLIVPKETLHGIKNNSTSDLTIMFVKEKLRH